MSDTISLRGLGRELKQVGAQAGLDRMGITSVAPLDRARRVLEERKRCGLAGSMQFTYRNPARSTDPKTSLPGARAVIVAAMGYPPGEHRAPQQLQARCSTAPTSRPLGRVARYAATEEHARLRVALDAVGAVLRRAGHRAVVVSDSNALVDRAIAERAGIGWYSKSANLMAPGLGSWFLIGSVVTDAALAPDGPDAVGGCGACRRCLVECPTGAIVAPGVVDARRCISWVLQAAQDIPVELREAIGDRVYGCDACLEACAAPRQSPSTASACGVDDPPGLHLDLLALLELDDAALLERHGGWYLANRDVDIIRRNAVVALANVADPTVPGVAVALRRCLAGPSDMVARHARWACDRLGIEP